MPEFLRSSSKSGDKQDEMDGVPEWLRFHVSGDEAIRLFARLQTSGEQMVSP